MLFSLVGWVWLPQAVHYGIMDIWHVMHREGVSGHIGIGMGTSFGTAVGYGFAW